MSYVTISALASDTDLITRAAACAATLGVRDPVTWAWGKAWELAVQDGWATKFKAATEAGMDRPGWNEELILDADILHAVEALLASEHAAPLEEGSAA